MMNKNKKEKPMTRDDVLTLLNSISAFKRKRIDVTQVPVQFLRNRIAVILPQEAYSPDEQIRLDGRFQNRMTMEQGVSAFIDFVPHWHGLTTPLSKGFH
jgi:hypothetical protein